AERQEDERGDQQVLLPHRRGVERLGPGPLLDGLVLIASPHQPCTSDVSSARCTGRRIPPLHSAIASRSSGRRFTMFRTAALTARVTNGRVSPQRNASIPKARAATLAPEAPAKADAPFP